MRQDGGTGPHECPFTDGHVTADMRSRPNLSQVSYRAVMVDSGCRVYDTPVEQPRSHAHIRHCTQQVPAPQVRERRAPSVWVDRVHPRSFRDGFVLPCDRIPFNIVSRRDKPRNLWPRKKRKRFRFIQDGGLDTVPFLRVVVGEPDRIVLHLEDVVRHLRTCTATDDDDFPAHAASTATLQFSPTNSKASSHSPALLCRPRTPICWM